MNLNLKALLASFAAPGAYTLLKESNPARPVLFIEPSDDTLPIFWAPLEALAELRTADPDLLVVDFKEISQREARRFACTLERERIAAREVEAAPSPQDTAFGSWMIRFRLTGEDKDNLQATSEVRPCEEAAELIEADAPEDNWRVSFVRNLPRKTARIIARYFELLTEEREATRREAERQAAEQTAAAEEPSP